MSVHDAVYPHSLGPGTPAPSRTSDYTGQYDSGPSLTYPPVPSLRSSVGQDPRSYYTQDPPRTAVRHPDNTAGYPDQYPVGNAKYYHSIPPGLGRHVSESPMYHADSYDCYSTGPIPYGQPPAVIAPYGVTGQTPGNYARQGAGLYEGQQSDDDYQRHNADRNRREGRTQDRFGQRNQRASRQNEYFLNGEGIHLDVLQRNICRYLGSEASARPSVFNGMRGFEITALRPFTSEMIHDLQDESTEYSSDVRNLSPEYRRDTRSVGYTTAVERR